MKIFFFVATLSSCQHLRIVAAAADDDIAMKNDFDMGQNNKFVSLVHTSTYPFCSSLCVFSMARRGAKCHSYSYSSSHRPNILLGQVRVVRNQMSDLLTDHLDQRASIDHYIRVAGIVLDPLYSLVKIKILFRKFQIAFRVTCNENLHKY